MDINKTYHICRTGKLRAHYTLYITISIVAKNFVNETCYFVQNLGLEKSDAVKKVNALISLDNNNCSIDFSDSKKREYCDLTAYNLKWKKTAKGFITTPDSNFWNVWRTNKQTMKDNGFSVFKNDNDQFVLFFKNCSNGEMIKKMAILDQKIKASGQFTGNIDDKIKDLSVTVEKVYEGNGDYGTFQNVTFVSDNGNTLKTRYSGSKYSFKDGEKILLSGTIKVNQVYNQINTTILTRVKKG